MTTSKFFTVQVFNSKSMKMQRKHFQTQQEADKYFNDKLENTQGRSVNDKAFSYVNEWGNIMAVAKKY